MSYAVKLNGTTKLEESTVQDKRELVVQELSENPSSIELFSYGFCCVAQGLITLACVASVVFVPVAFTYGIFSTLP